MLLDTSAVTGSFGRSCRASNLVLKRRQRGIRLVKLFVGTLVSMVDKWERMMVELLGRGMKPNCFEDIVEYPVRMLVKATIESRCRFA